MAKITLSSNIINDEYTEYVYKAYDIQDQSKTVTEIEFSLGEAKTFPWNIGVILGNSGSGKSSILKRLGEIKTPSFDPDKALISNFSWMKPEEVTHLFTSMGLSSVPTWLRPFRVLSNGEQYRAMLAYLVASSKDGEVILIDEYTSVVDRDVAKAMSFALQKYIRKQGKRLIVASCHYDILDWLMPDWICSPQKGGAVERCDYLRRGRPKIELSISRVESQAWDIFKKHHYLTSEVNKGFGFLLFEWNNKPIGVVVYKNQPSAKVPNARGLSRTVVLPDYQGMGIGSKISDFTSSILSNEGYRVYTKTVNPALGEYRNSSPNWKPSSKNGKIRKDIGTDTKAKNRLDRRSYCHEFVGSSVGGYEDLLHPIDSFRKSKHIIPSKNV